MVGDIWFECLLIIINKISSITRYIAESENGFLMNKVWSIFRLEIGTCLSSCACPLKTDIWLPTGEVLNWFNPKGAGSFDPISQPGGGGGGGTDSAPPPRISAAERRKIMKFGTYVGLVNTNVLTKLQYWKSKRIWIMQIYVNYMHVFLFFIITDKMRPFGAFKLFWYCCRNI